MNQNIASIGIAVPPCQIEQSQAMVFFSKYYSNTMDEVNKIIFNKIINHPSVKTRHFAFNTPEDLVNEDPDSRISRFTRWSIRLSHEAITKALADAGIGVQDVTGLIVNTCTGYLCPGIATYLVEDMGFRKTIVAYDLVGSGCGGAIPNIQLAKGLLQNNKDSVIVSVSVEICSATFQMKDDLSLLVSNAIFSDGAAAAVLWNKPGTFQLVDSISSFFPEYREDIRFVHKNGELHNQLSGQLPRLVAKPVADTIGQLLGSHGLTNNDIRHWAFHPGGDKIISTIQQELNFSDDAFRQTRDVLARYGNMSSPTVWFVLKNIMDSGINPGEYCMMVAFGAGFAVHAYLLKVS